MKPNENLVFVTTASGVPVIHGHRPPYISHSLYTYCFPMLDILVAATSNPFWFWSTYLGVSNSSH